MSSVLVPGDSMLIVRCHISGVRYQVSDIAWQVPVSDIMCQIYHDNYWCQVSCVKYSMASTGVGYHVSNIVGQVSGLYMSGSGTQYVGESPNIKYQVSTGVGYHMM